MAHEGRPREAYTLDITQVYVRSKPKMPQKRIPSQKKCTSCKNDTDCYDGLETLVETVHMFSMTIRTTL